MKLVIGIAGALIIWSLWGLYSSNVEKAKYEVIQKKPDYEIRQYAEQIVAQTTVKGSYNDALNEGFSIIANYIFGGNTKKEKIAMTAPVLEQKNEPNENSEKIAMTAPVLASTEGETRTVAFVMPSSYNLENLPTPNDSRVEINSIPSKKMAALKFSWYYSEKRVNKMKERLLELLKKDNIELVGTEPQFAGYNDPFTPPWMMRNEILVEIK